MMLRSFRFRAFVAGMGTVALLFTAAVPALAAKPSTDPAAILARLATSEDEDAAFRALSTQEREALIAYVTVATIQVIETVSPTRASEVTSAAAASCYTATKTLVAKDYLGLTMWTYSQKVDWCANPTTHLLTSASRTRWAQVYMAYWQFTGHVGSSISGGAGYSSYHAFTQGEFANCFPILGCVQWRYPWVDMYAYWNGTVSGSMGG